MRYLALALCLPLSAGIPQDKALHAAAGAVAYVGGYHVAKALNSEHPRLWAMAGVVALGVVKEAYDKRHPLTNTADPLDALATVAGGVSVSFVWRF
jgi:hypothetical protein